MKRKQSRQALARRLGRKLAIVADETRALAARKSAARYAANLAEKLGLIDRPPRCEWCGMRLPLERHHPDHSQPLAVLFLCCFCHRLADDMGRADLSAAVSRSAA